MFLNKEVILKDTKKLLHLSFVNEEDVAWRDDSMVKHLFCKYEDLSPHP